MTDKQIERVQKKILRLKKALAQDKKFWGGQYHDGQGLRYLLPEQYIKIEDYKGGLRYLNWFQKNFPDDSGFPIFLFEWAFILFKCNKLKEAESKVHSTFFSNTYILDIFLERDVLQFNKSENQSWELEAVAKGLYYRKSQPGWAEFAGFVETVLQSREFLDKANEFIALEQQIKDLPVGDERSELIKRTYIIKYGNLPEDDD